ncbi:hypothetical protein M3Y99_00769300 [Aphelenchoides fujianensis]|nr:hypothetical protein M3Y99_00769300 [Aphelenchoides fujianensis]
MQTLKWGIIGCGNIASDFVHALRNSPYDHRVIAAGARSLQKAEEFAERAMWSRFHALLDAHSADRPGRKSLGKATHFHLNIAGRNPRFNLPTCEVPTLSTGVYCVSLAFFLFGESPVRIHAVGEKNEEGFEEWCNLSLVFEDGKHATLYFGRACLSAWTAYIARAPRDRSKSPTFCWAPTEFTKINGPIRVGATKIGDLRIPTAG